MCKTRRRQKRMKEAIKGNQIIPRAVEPRKKKLDVSKHFASITFVGLHFMHSVTIQGAPNCFLVRNIFTCPLYK